MWEFTRVLWAKAAYVKVLLSLESVILYRSKESTYKSLFYFFLNSFRVWRCKNLAQEIDKNVSTWVSIPYYVKQLEQWQMKTSWYVSWIVLISFKENVADFLLLCAMLCDINVFCVKSLVLWWELLWHKFGKLFVAMLEIHWLHFIPISPHFWGDSED